jgi:predicted GH43/DUF377 family glycosyl hydrolase
MNNNAVDVRRTTTLLGPDRSRVLLRPFHPGSRQRAERVVARIMAIPEPRVGPLLEAVMVEFFGRHRQISQQLIDRFEKIRYLLAPGDELSEQRRLLIGSYFVAEFSLESAALFNPSIVPHPDQSDVPDGGLRFILSLRATGEGHVSSITFRTGMIHADHRIEVTRPTGLLTEPRQIPNPSYEKALFERKLFEVGFATDFTRRVMSRLDEVFGLEVLRSGLDAELKQSRESDEEKTHQITAEGIWMLAKSNYEVQFEPDQNLSERIIFPATPSQRNGIEDARFVHFQNDDGTRTYYATYTAFDGKLVLPELVATCDFLHFRFATLNGPAAQNKGMALFPRKINGQYAMLSRQDNENIYVMFSDNIHFWYDTKLVMKPKFPWELIQLGNCGSPIETDAGWLVLSHGVGPMRKYCIGAFLLDRDNPAKVIGRLQKPLLKPNHNEREGYVPNVVYTCGALLHDGELVVPYGLADYATSFATIPLHELLAAMQ